MLPVAILCGGLATRLRPITEKIPKSLVPVNGEPFIFHQLRLLASNGISEVVLCVAHLGEMIKHAVGDGGKLGLHVSYSEDGEKLLGTAGAIRRALPLVGQAFFVLYGDSYLPCDYASIGYSFIKWGRPGLMTIYRNLGQFDASNVEAEHGTIVRYDKRNRSDRMHYIDYGLGVFDRSVFDEIEPDRVCDLADVYQRLLVERQLSSFEVPERFYEIGSPGGIADLETYLASTI